MPKVDFSSVIADLGRDELVSLARTSESAERYEDMCTVMSKLVKSNQHELLVEERNLLSVAFKNVVGARRASLRTLAGDDAAVVMYKGQLQAELKKVCTTILDLLKNNLIDKGKKHDDAQVFYLKMGADYYRYLAECVPDDNAENAQQANDFYEAAFDIAKAILPSTHPIRLGLALNYSVCKYEIVKQKEEACKLAKEAFDEAISELDKLEEADYKDSTLIMQLLRDNLTLWTASSEDPDGDDEN